MTSEQMWTTAERAALDPSVVEEFAAGLRGGVLRPGVGGYDEARRVWNGMIDRSPALIARCAGATDVAAAVRFARDRGLLVAVRGGGHHVAGSAVCDGGLVIDLSGMKGIRVDPAARTIRAEAGVTWGELDRATQAWGLATPGGVVSDTGIAGLTLGGGLGWLRRKHGLAIDNLLAVEIVTADGRLRRASAREEPDLFWAVRGGGGNFGVVTAFEYRLHPVGPDVMFGLVFHPASVAREALRFYREYTATAPEEVSSFAILGPVPAAPPFPPQTHGTPCLVFAACHAGPVEEGARVLQPLRDFGAPLADLSAPTPFVEVQATFDEDYPAGKLRYYWKSRYLDALGDAAIDRLVALAAERPSPLSTVDIWQLGGAMGRVGAGDSAFGRRDAPFLLGVEANWAAPAEDERNIAWARRVCAAMAPFATARPYPNLEAGEGLARAAYGANYDRLVALKRRYDPANLFRLNQNFAPA